MSIAGQDSSTFNCGKGQQPPGEGGLPGQRPAKYIFTPEEIRVIKECNRESFFYRSMPIGTAFAGITYMAIQKGLLTASPKWGAAPKICMALGFGYFVGKFSYHKTCLEKILALPNSPLADMIRKNKGQGKYGFNEVITLDPSFSSSGMINAPEQESSYQSNYTDIGDTRPMEGNDSFSNSAFDTTAQMLNEDTLPQKPQFFTSYDDLRNQNRNEFEKSNRPPPPREETRPMSRPVYQNPPSQPPQIQDPRKRNIYGDVWDDKPE